MEAAQQERAELDSQGSNTNYLTLKEGKNVVRVLPPAIGSNTPFRRVTQHYIKRATEGTLVIPCPLAMLKKPCPVCERVRQLSASRSKADQELAKSYLGKRRIYADVIDRSDPEAGPKVLGFGKMVEDDLIAIREDPDVGGDFTHPEKGFDIIIEKTGTGMQTRYKANAARNDSALGNMEWLAMRNDIARIGTPEDYDDIVARLAGGDPSAGRQAPAETSRQLDSGDTGRGRGRSSGGVTDAIDVDDVSKPQDDISW